MLYVRGSSSTPISAQTINTGAQATAAVTTNSTAEELWDQVDVAITMGTSVTNLSPWVLYLVPYLADDSAAASVTTPPASIYLVAQWPCASGTSAQAFSAHGIALPPGNFTYVLYNGTNQNSSATSCSLHRRPYHVA